MNTFLPYEDFMATAECLDEKRLGRQRADVVNILKALSEPPPQDGHEHAAVKMWRGNEQWLIQYGIMICTEWRARGNTDNTLTKIMGYRTQFEGHDEKPEWLGDATFHDSHKSLLLRSQPSHYRQFWKDLADDLAQVFPRAPERGRASVDEKAKAKLVARAIKLKERAEDAIQAAHEAAARAGLDPETMQPLDDIEVDPELEAL